MSYSYTTSIGDGITTVYPFSFAGQDLGYLAVSNVVVFVAGTPVPFTIPSNDPNKAYLTSAPPVGAEVLIRRVMPKNVPYSDFARGNPFSQDALNNTNLQQLYIVQEILDGYMPTGFYFKSDINMGGYKLVNLGEGTQAGDSVRYEQWLENKDRLDRIELGLVDNVAQRTVPWYYIATGGETELSPPYDFQAALVYRGGLFQNQGLGAFSITNNKIKLAEPLEPKEEFYALLGSSPAAPDDYAKLTEVIRLIEESKNTRELWRRSLAEIGLTLVPGSFKESATVNGATDAVWDVDGAQCYTWTGDLSHPKEVPASSTPESTGGIVDGAWASVGDASVRAMLAKNIIFSRERGLLADGVTNERATLSAIRSLAGSLGLSVIVPAVGSVRDLMHNEPVRDLMPQQLVDLGNLKSRLSVYEPTKVPTWNVPVENAAQGTESVTAASMYALYDALLSRSDGNLVRQTDIGVDQSGVYPIRHYLWTGANSPSNATPDKRFREILVTAGVHGSETVGVLGLYYFMKDLVERGRTDPSLIWLFYNTRIRFIPIVDPWGLSQTPKVRANSRGVNLNRNMDYRWSDAGVVPVGDANYKGESAFSESETAALRDWFSQYAASTVAYVDIHNKGEHKGDNNTAPQYTGFCSPLSDKYLSELMPILMQEDQQMDISNGQLDPTTANYASTVYGLPSITCEHTDSAWARPTASYSQARDTSYSLTGATKWYGNVICHLAKNAVRAPVPFEVFSRTGAGDATPVPLPATDAFVNIFEKKSYDCGVDGYLKVSGWVTFKNNGTETAIVTLSVNGKDGFIRKCVPYCTIPAGASDTLYVSVMVKTNKLDDRKYPVTLQGAANKADVSAVRWGMTGEPRYCGLDASF